MPRRKKAASLLQALVPQDSAQQNTGGGGASEPLGSPPRGSRRQGDMPAEAGGIQDTYDNYDDQATAIDKGATWPRHLDDMMFYATTPLPYYTVNGILGIGYHPEITEKAICEEIYDDWVKWKHQIEVDEESPESESVEMVQMFTQVTEALDER